MNITPATHPLAPEPRHEDGKWLPWRRPRTYLQLLAVLVVHRHGDLHVLGRGLAALVELPLDQSDVDVVPHVP